MSENILQEKCYHRIIVTVDTDDGIAIEIDYRGRLLIHRGMPNVKFTRQNIVTLGNFLLFS